MSRNKPLLTIIIPAYNEESNIENTLLTLLNQADPGNNELDKSLYQIVLVNNNSADKTLGVAEGFAEKNPLPKLYVINEKKQGITPARIAGYNFVINNKGVSTPYLASGDSDISFHKNWVYTMLKYFKKMNVDVISNAGCFPNDFWIKVPNLVDRYLDEVGTLFFNPETISWVKTKRKNFLFTEQLFFDFVRPVTDGCFAISAEAYKKCGGYTLEYWDAEKKRPVHGEGWRLVFKLERTNASILYVNEAPYNSSPRRILEEPDKFLGTTSYSRENVMTNLRKESTNAYEALNKYAKYVDLKPVQKYIIDYYILLKCITRPQLIKQHPQYFGGIQKVLYNKIDTWWKDREVFEGKDLFTLSNQLGDEYFEVIMENIPRQRAF